MGAYEFDQPDDASSSRASATRRTSATRSSTSTSTATCSRSRYCVGRRVVDVACGEGYGAAFLGKVAAEVVGVDSSVEAIEHASKAYGSPNVVFHAADAASIPVEDGYADVVVSFETIEHLDDQPAFVAEVARILRPDGLLDPLHAGPRGVPGAEANPFHVHELDRAELTALLERHFARVVVGGQRSDAGSSIAFPASVESPAAASFFDRAGAGELPRLGELPAPVYLIALATNGALPEAGSSTLFDSHYLPRLHGRVSELESDAQARARGAPRDVRAGAGAHGARRLPRRCGSACSPRSSPG